MRKLTAFVAAFLLAVSSLFVLATPKALAANKTWDGGGSDNNMTTAANWNGDSAPSVGDDLFFPANVDDRTVVNDFSAGTSFNSITFTGAATQASDYTLSGNAMTLVAGVTNSMSGSFATSATLDLALTLNGNQSFIASNSSLDFNGTINLGSNTLTTNAGTGSINLDGVVSGTGAITKSGTGMLQITGDNTYSGATNINVGLVLMRHVNAFGTAAGATTVASDASLLFVQGTGDATITEPLTLNGDGLDEFTATLGVATGYGMGGSIVVPFPQTTFSGAITLGSNIKLSASTRNGKITGAITGNYTMSLFDTSTGTFEIASSSNGSATPNSVLAPPTKTTEYKDNSPSTDINVYTNETAIVTGTYGQVSVNYGGTLKGTGTVGITYVYGKIAPGLSPGCLTTSDLTLATSATYEFELAGKTACTEYDQIKANGAVTVGGTLNVTLLNNFKPVVGQKYVIISNDGSDKVSETFSGLAEGATVTVGSTSFKISYAGGDGNDVELTVLAGAPVTGFTLLKSNPLVTAGVIMVAAFGILLIARRSNKLFARR